MNTLETFSAKNGKLSVYRQPQRMLLLPVPSRLNLFRRAVMSENETLTPGQWQRATKQALELSRRMQAAGEKEAEQGRSAHAQDATIKAAASQK